jgi:hypothetical protein
MKVSRRAVPGLPFLFLSLPLASCDVPTAPPRIQSTWRFPTETLDVLVTGVSATTIETRDMSAIDLVDRIQSAVIHVLPVNPRNASGTAQFVMSGSGVTVLGNVNVRGNPDQPIPLTQAQVRALLGGVVTFRATATLCPASGCGLVMPPFDSVTLHTELELVVELGGEG